MSNKVVESTIRSIVSNAVPWDVVALSFVTSVVPRSVTVASELLMRCVAVAVRRRVSHGLGSAAAQNVLC